MKTKFEISIPVINVETEGVKVEIPAIEIKSDVEVQVTELKDLYALQKQVIQETPGLLSEFAAQLAIEFVRVKALAKEEFKKDEDFARDLEYSHHVAEKHHEIRMDRLFGEDVE